MSFDEDKDWKVPDQSCWQKSKKQTFYCSVCNITLNSEATMKIHCEGVRHMKRSESFGVQNDDLGVIRIPNPKSRKKIPIKLAQKISDSSSGQTIVGLDYITEYIPVSDDEMEPHYRCGLCDSSGQSNCMMSHLTGKNHRYKFARSLPGNEALLDDVSQADLAKIARDHDERKAGFEMRIKTIRSDEDYPWPPGKAPWLVENGGTGLAPQSQLPKRKMEVEPSDAAASERKKKKPNKAAWREIDPSEVRPPSSREEAIKMMLLAERMLELGLESRGASSTDITLLKITCDLVLDSLL